MCNKPEWHTVFKKKAPQYLRSSATNDSAAYLRKFIHIHTVFDSPN